MPEFTRGFRLILPDGDTYDGAVFPSGRHITDHRERGLCVVAVDMAALLEEFPDGASVEWADEPHRQ